MLFIIDIINYIRTNLGYLIFRQITNPVCKCYYCVDRQKKEKGFIRYIHCHYCDLYFYRLDKYYEHFEKPTNSLICPYPIIRIDRS